jgi:hypothetical protein
LLVGDEAAPIDETFASAAAESTHAPLERLWAIGVGVLLPLATGFSFVVCG